MQSHERQGQRAGEAIPYGLGVASGGLRLEVESGQLRVAQAGLLKFRILDGQSRAVTSFDVMHERAMHLILVRRDLWGFQHLHPEMDEEGNWTAGLTLPQAGSWRAFADFSVAGEAQTLGIDLAVAGDYQPVALPQAADRFELDGIQTRVSYDALAAGGHAEMVFRISRENGPVTVEPYLGAGGHLVALREGDLAFLHVHPTHFDLQNAEVRFATSFPSSGRYALYLQFSVGGQINTAAFTVDVSD